MGRMGDWKHGASQIDAGGFCEVGQTWRGGKKRRRRGREGESKKRRRRRRNDDGGVEVVYM